MVLPLQFDLFAFYFSSFLNALRLLALIPVPGLCPYTLFLEPCAMRITPVRSAQDTVSGIQQPMTSIQFSLHPKPDT
jgi:hypothetical protein